MLIFPALERITRGAVSGLAGDVIASPLRLASEDHVAFI